MWEVWMRGMRSNWQVKTCRWRWQAEISRLLLGRKDTYLEKVPR